MDTNEKNCCGTLQTLVSRKSASTASAEAKSGWSLLIDISPWPVSRIPVFQILGDLTPMDDPTGDQLLLGGLPQIKALFLGVPTSTIDQPRLLANKSFDISLSAGLKCRPDGGMSPDWEINTAFVDAQVLANGCNVMRCPLTDAPFPFTSTGGGSRDPGLPRYSHQGTHGCHAGSCGVSAALHPGGPQC